LINQITYKAEEVGIHVVLTEESYTSKVDHLANETLEHHETYLGKRIKRGLFRSSYPSLLNADVNGAIGILRKVIGNDFLQNEFFEEKLLNRGLVVNPLKALFS
jgi:transposase